MIQTEFGKAPEELYASIEHEPFAAASTAQVHRATLHDGTLVAVKVQRPRIVAKTKADLGVIQELASVAERRIGMARKVGARGMVDEFATGVLKELDYRNEAYHALRLADNMQRFPADPHPAGLPGAVRRTGPDDGVRHGHQDLQGRRAPGGRSRHVGTRVGLHPGDHQAGPDRRLLPRRSASGQRPGRPGRRHDRLPRPRTRRPARPTAAARPARSDLRHQGGRHPGDRRWAHRARQAVGRLRRGRLPERHRPTRSPVPDLRQGRDARAPRSARSCRPCSTTASGSTPSSPWR